MTTTKRKRHRKRRGSIPELGRFVTDKGRIEVVLKGIVGSRDGPSEKYITPSPSAPFVNAKRMELLL